jgi:hypothetical protein
MTKTLGERERERAQKLLSMTFQNIFEGVVLSVCLLISLSVSPHIASPQEISSLVCYKTCFYKIKDEKIVIEKLDFTKDMVKCNYFTNQDGKSA